LKFFPIEVDLFSNTEITKLIQHGGHRKYSLHAWLRGSSVPVLCVLYQKTILLKKISIVYSIAILCFLSAALPKKRRMTFTDFESIDKDDSFRTQIKTGNFIKLSVGLPTMNMKTKMQIQSW